MPFKIHTHAPFTSPTSAAKREQSNAGEVKVFQDLFNTRPCPTSSIKYWFDFSTFAFLLLSLGCFLPCYIDAADSAEEGEDGDDGEENYLNSDEDLTMMITTCT